MSCSATLSASATSVKSVAVILPQEIRGIRGSSLPQFPTLSAPSAFSSPSLSSFAVSSSAATSSAQSLATIVRTSRIFTNHLSHQPNQHTTHRERSPLQRKDLSPVAEDEREPAFCYRKPFSAASTGSIINSCATASAFCSSAAASVSTVPPVSFSAPVSPLVKSAAAQSSRSIESFSLNAPVVSSQTGSVSVASNQPPSRFFAVTRNGRVSLEVCEQCLLDGKWEAAIISSKRFLSANPNLPLTSQLAALEVIYRAFFNMAIDREAREGRSEESRALLIKALEHSTLCQKLISQISRDPIFLAAQTGQLLYNQGLIHLRLLDLQSSEDMFARAYEQFQTLIQLLLISKDPLAKKKIQEAEKSKNDCLSRWHEVKEIIKEQEAIREEEREKDNDALEVLAQINLTEKNGEEPLTQRGPASPFESKEEPVKCSSQAPQHISNKN